MKYTKEEYENIDFSAGEEEIINHEQKLVKTRKPHQCVDCEEEIPKGEYMVRETGFMDDGPVSCYHCLGCCDAYLEQEEDEEE